MWVMSDLAADPNEDLDDGYRSTTPGRDNLLLAFVRADSAGFGAVAASHRGRVLSDDSLGLEATDLSLPTPFGNTAHLLAPMTEASTRPVVDQLHAFYSAVPGGPFMLFSPFPTPDLRGHGFVRVGHPPLMLRVAGGTATDAPGLDIIRVTDAERLADFERTFLEAYPVPEMQSAPRASWLHPSVLESSWQFFVGYEQDRPVATAAAFVNDHVIDVGLVSTLTEARGRGYGAAITSAATFAAPQLPAMLIASDLGRNIYENLGYCPLLRYTLWIGTR